MPQFRLRSSLTDTPAYVPGRPADPIPDVTSYKLSSNEHHLPPLPQVADAIAQAAGTPQLYPDPSAHDLTVALSSHLGVEPGEVVFGAGASEILSALIQVTGEPGSNIVYPWPSFEMYPQLISLSGATKRPVPLTAEAEHDLEEMALAVDDDTRLVLLCSPNNPTGPIITGQAFDDFMQRVPADVIVVLDQAYLEFISDDEAVRGIEALRTYPNLVLVRTFSKAHGLAGLRVGYAVAGAGIIHELRKSIAPFSVTDLAQAAAQASLTSIAEVEVRAKEVAALRDALAEGLRGAGWNVPRSHANFVWVPTGEKSADFEAACRAVGLSVRNLGSGVRISVGPQEAIDRAIEVAQAFGGPNE